MREALPIKPSFEGRWRGAPEDRVAAAPQFLFYASNAGGLAHVRSSATSIQTAEIPDQVRNDDISLAPHYVLGSPERGAGASLRSASRVRHGRLCLIGGNSFLEKA